MSGRVGATVSTLTARATVRVRGKAFRDPDSTVVRAVPRSLRERWKLVPPPPGERRIEIGSGLRPTPGYIHVEPSPGLPEVHFPTTGDDIPLGREWADEILSVHMIEHVPAAHVQTVLRRWHNLLRPGGALVLHTPNADALCDVISSYDAVPHEVWWAAQAALFGYNRAPDKAKTPRELGTFADHALGLTWGALRDLLEEAGFADVRNVTGTLDCDHQRDWAKVVPNLCLEVSAVATGAR